MPKARLINCTLNLQSDIEKTLHFQQKFIKLALKFEVIAGFLSEISRKILLRKFWTIIHVISRNSTIFASWMHHRTKKNRRYSTSCFFLCYCLKNHFSSSTLILLLYVFNCPSIYTIIARATPPLNFNHSKNLHFTLNAIVKATSCSNCVATENKKKSSQWNSWLSQINHSEKKSFNYTISSNCSCRQCWFTQKIYAQKSAIKNVNIF